MIIQSFLYNESFTTVGKPFQRCIHKHVRVIILKEVDTIGNNTQNNYQHKNLHGNYSNVEVLIM